MQHRHQGQFPVSIVVVYCQCHHINAQAVKGREPAGIPWAKELSKARRVAATHRLFGCCIILGKVMSTRNLKASSSSNGKYRAVVESS